LSVATLGRWYVTALKSVIASLFAGLVVTAFYQVVSRYVFGRTPAWTEEAARYLAVWVVLLTSALAIEFRGHIAVDLILVRLPRRVRLLTASVGWAGILLFLVVFTYESIQLLGVAAGQVTPDGLHLRNPSARRLLHAHQCEPSRLGFRQPGTPRAAGTAVRLGRGHRLLLR
jgi:TRAP-type C4-dicarboxylate transport system permease small subunit